MNDFLKDIAKTIGNEYAEVIDNVDDEISFIDPIERVYSRWSSIE